MPLGIVVTALTAVIIWGATPVAAKVAVATLSPLAVVFFRMALGAVVALPLAFSFRIPLPKTWDQKVLLLLSGFCGFVGFPVLFTIGVGFTSANHSSMLLAYLPIFTGAIAMAWDKQFPQVQWWLGCLIALIGELLLILSNSDSNTGNSSLTGDVMVLISNLFASLGYVAGGRLEREGYSSTGTTFWGVVIGAALLLPITPFIIADIELSKIPSEVWISVIYLAIPVNILGYLLWYRALGKGGIERIGLIQFFQPISGVILAWLLLNEQLTLNFFFASVLVLIGVWFALKTR